MPYGMPTSYREANRETARVHHARTLPHLRQPPCALRKFPEVSRDEVAAGAVPRRRQPEARSFMPYRLVVLFLLVVGAELTSPDRSPAEEAQRGSSSQLRWSACRDVPDVECAGLEVPVDPGRPDAAQFTIRLGRVPATDPARKKGVLLFIPGGPGVGISGLFRQFRRLQHIDDFARQYDVVSFD